MAVIKCKMCGGDLTFVEGTTIAQCEYCDSVQTVPKVDDEKKLTLFGRANRLRLACEFDKAAGVYEAIVADFPEEAEAYWGLVLCNYGIEYVDDPATGKKVPTCHRSSFESVLEDSDFEQVMENADEVARKIYRQEAKAIEELRRGIISVSSNEEPYDIFICYKETDSSGERTIDSVLAQDVYDVLTERGYRVFFSRITLEDRLGVEYEPYIFAALNSAKVMLAFGTDYEYYNAVWVKNEWSRYLKLMAKDKSKYLIPCYKGIDAYDMPKEFAKLQAQDMGKVGAVQDLLRGIEKILPRQTETVPSAQEAVQVPTQINNPTVESYLKRAFMFLEDGDWRSADEYSEKVLDIDPENARAYLAKLLAEVNVPTVNALQNCRYGFDGSGNYKKLMKFGDEALRAQIQQLLQIVYSEQLVRNSVIQNGVLKKYNHYPGGSGSIKIPETVKCIAEGAFENCTGLTEIHIPESVQIIGGLAFSGCTGLTTVTIPGGVESVSDYAFSDCTNLKNVVIREGVKNLGYNVFEGCEELEHISMPDSLQEIGWDLLYGCDKVSVYASMTSYAWKWAKKNNYTVITDPETEKQAKRWRGLGKCQYCGGELKGLLKKCTVCGRRKDY